MRQFISYEAYELWQTTRPALHISGAKINSATNITICNMGISTKPIVNQRSRATSTPPVASVLRHATRITSTVARDAAGVKKHAEKLEIESHAPDGLTT